jgi:hypothetical protein
VPITSSGHATKETRTPRWSAQTGFVFGGSDYEDLQVLGITVARLHVLERRG